jgi:hypothetical protein
VRRQLARGDADFGGRQIFDEERQARISRPGEQPFRHLAVRTLPLKFRFVDHFDAGFAKPADRGTNVVYTNAPIYCALRRPDPWEKSVQHILPLCGEAPD